jgi:hypothetical protein
VAAITKLLSLQSGVSRTIQTGDTVAAPGAWTFAENAVFNAPVLFNGGATGIISENVLIKDPFTVHASDYQVDADRAAGNVFVTRGSATFAITSVAGNKFLTATDPTATIAANDFISIANPADPLNLGIYEVSAVDAAGVTIKTSPDASVAGIVSDSTTASGAGGTVAKARISIFKADAAGDQMSVAYGSASPLVFQKMLEADDLSMQSAYDGGAATTLAGGVPVSWALSAGGNDFSVQGAGSMLIGTDTELDTMYAYAGSIGLYSTSAFDITCDSSGLSFAPNSLQMNSDLIEISNNSVQKIYSYDSAVDHAKQQKPLEHTFGGQSGAPFTPEVGYTPTAGDVVAMSAGAATIRKADADSELESRPVGFALYDVGNGTWFVAMGHGQRGVLTFDAAVNAADIGKMAYLSSTGGAATLLPPDAAGTHIVELGVVIDANGASTASILWSARYVAAN